MQLNLGGILGVFHFNFYTEWCFLHDGVFGSSATDVLEVSVLRWGGVAGGSAILVPAAH